MGRVAWMPRADKHRDDRQRRPASLRGTAARWRLALVPWLCALLLALNCTIIQGHFHPGSQASRANTERAPAADNAARNLPVAASQGGSSGQSKFGCILCEQMALAGSAILPGDAAPVHVAAGPDATPITYQAVSVMPVVSHDWRSRAPPALL